jgi:hypothetical protein
MGKVLQFKRPQEEPKEPETWGIGAQLTLSPNIDFDESYDIVIDTQETDYLIINFSEDESEEDG